MPKPQPLTRAYFDKAIKQLARSTTSRKDLEQLRDHLRFDLRDFRKRLSADIAALDDRLEVIEVKLEAVMERLALRDEMRNLVSELNRQGVAIDSAKVFTTS